MHKLLSVLSPENSTGLAKCQRHTEQDASPCRRMRRLPGCPSPRQSPLQPAGRSLRPTSPSCTTSGAACSSLRSSLPAPLLSRGFAATHLRVKVIRHPSNPWWCVMLQACTLPKNDCWLQEAKVVLFAYKARLEPTFLSQFRVIPQMISYWNSH